MAANYFKRRRLSISQQIACMSALQPQLNPTCNRGTVTWRGPLRPAAISTIYRAKISYKPPRFPTVSILAPKLTSRGEDEQIPHVYPGNLPCLSRPALGEWTSHLFIATTIVPWLCLWLYYYEVWHATGEWFGGGDHPVVKEDGT